MTHSYKVPISWIIPNFDMKHQKNLKILQTPSHYHQIIPFLIQKSDLSKKSLKHKDSDQLHLITTNYRYTAHVIFPNLSTVEEIID